MQNPRKADPTPDGRGQGSATGDLADRIARAQANRSAGQNRPAGRAVGQATTMSRGLRLGTEFIAAIVVGLGAGYLLDQWLKTTPWLMLVMLLLGFAAGVLNVVRSASEMNRAAPLPPAASSIPEDADEDE